jgi:uncharacterized membrane protein
MEKSRIAALVDGIFAVAMTLLVLDLKFPENLKFTSDSEVWRQLLALTGHFAAYGLSFVVLGAFWIGHHSLFHFVRKVNRSMLWLNLLFLLFVTLLPFSTNLVSADGNLQVPVVVYGLNLFLISLVSFLQLSYLVHHRELAHPAFTAPWIANLRQRTLISTVVILASIAVSFYKPHLAIDVYWLLMVFHFLPGKHHRSPAVND